MANLYTIGNTHLGKSSPVKLSELNSSHAEDRVYGTYGYKRVNSLEVARGHAPAPAGNTSGATGTANSLAKWNNYDQWSGGIDGEDRGDEFDLTAQTFDDSSVCNQSATFTWQMDNYEDFPVGYVQQQFYLKTCSSAGCENCSGDDPLDGVSQQNNIDTHSPGTYTLNANINQLTYYVVGVRMQWNDEADGGSTYTQTDGISYKTKASLTYSANACTNNIDSTADNVIIFRTGADPQCTNQLGIRVTTSNDYCDACCAFTTSAYRNSAGAYSIGTCYSSGTAVGCAKKCVTPASPQTSWKWIASGGTSDGTAYPMNGGCVIGGTTHTCSGCWC